MLPLALKSRISIFHLEVNFLTLLQVCRAEDTPAKGVIEHAEVPSAPSEILKFLVFFLPSFCIY